MITGYWGIIRFKPASPFKGKEIEAKESRVPLAN